MDLSQLQFFQAAHKEMQRIDARQEVLAENIANSDTPGYRPQELKEPSFKQALQQQSQSDPSSLGPVRTDPDHSNGMTMASAEPASTDPDHLGTAGGTTQFETQRAPSQEVTPNGNGVVLEQEMQKLAENRIDHTKITRLYRKQLGFIKTALGK